MAEQHCEAHSGVCERVNGVQAQVGALCSRIDEHCRNGGAGHVQRHELTTLREDVSTLTTEVAKVCEAVSAMQAGEARATRGNAWRQTLAQCVTQILVGILTAGAAYLALASKLAH